MSAFKFLASRFLSSLKYPLPDRTLRTPALKSCPFLLASSGQSKQFANLGTGTMDLLLDESKLSQAMELTQLDTTMARLNGAGGAAGGGGYMGTPSMTPSGTPHFTPG